MSFWQLLEISMIAFSVLGVAYLGWRIGRFDIWRRMFPVKVRRLSAAILLVVSRELMRDFNEYSMLMLGGLMVLMMIWRPQGLLPMTRPQLKLKNGAAKGEQA